MRHVAFGVHAFSAAQRITGRTLTGALHTDLQISTTIATRAAMQTGSFGIYASTVAFCGCGSRTSEFAHAAHTKFPRFAGRVALTAMATVALGVYATALTIGACAAFTTSCCTLFTAHALNAATTTVIVVGLGIDA